MGDKVRDRASQLILIVAALLSGAWAIRNLLEVWEPFEGGGGIGAVSFGISEALLESVPIIIVVSVVISRRVKMAARRHSRLADGFRRVYLWLMAGYLTWSVASVAWLMLAQGSGMTTFYVALMGTYLVAGTFLPLQLFFAAAAVAFVVGHPTSSPPAQ